MRQQCIQRVFTASNHIKKKNIKTIADMPGKKSLLPGNAACLKEIERKQKGRKRNSKVHVKRLAQFSNMISDVQESQGANNSKVKRLTKSQLEGLVNDLRVDSTGTLCSPSFPGFPERSRAVANCLG